AEFLSPLYQQNAVFGEKVVEAQRLKLARSLHAIEINMVKIHSRTAIFVDEGKRGTGYIFFSGCLKCCGDPLDESGFASAKVSAQEHQLWRRQHRRQSSSEGNGFFRRMRGEFPGGHRDRDDQYSGRAVLDGFWRGPLPGPQTSKASISHRVDNHAQGAM